MIYHIRYCHLVLRKQWTKTMSTGFSPFSIHIFLVKRVEDAICMVVHITNITCRELVILKQCRQKNLQISNVSKSTPLIK